MAEQEHHGSKRGRFLPRPSRRALTRREVEGGARVVVLGVEVGAAVEQPLKALDVPEAGQLAQQENININTIGIGADQVVQRTFFGARAINPSAELDEAVLTQIAESTGGRYFRARDVNDLVGIYEELDRLETVEQDEQTYRPTRVLFYWPLGAALIISFLLTLFSIPWLSLTGRARVHGDDDATPRPDVSSA